MFKNWSRMEKLMDRLKEEENVEVKTGKIIGTNLRIIMAWINTALKLNLPNYVRTNSSNQFAGIHDHCH